MTTFKPLASLSPSLLARKGAARPAMRPQLQPLRQFQEATARQLNEDLGWDDMGHEQDEPDTAEPAAIEHSPVEPATIAEVVPINPVEPAAEPEIPEIVRLQAKVAEDVASAGKRRSALAEGRRAAFTLRVDSERHLKLRLACVVANRSAQQLITDALDRLLSDMSGLDTLSDQVRKRGAKS